MGTSCATRTASRCESSPGRKRLSVCEFDAALLANMTSHTSFLSFPSRRSYALSEINRMKSQGHDIRAAVASKTDEPRWARVCLDHLLIADGSVLKDCFEDRLIEISYSSKAQHLERLHRKTGIPYESMAFFDNEHWNIQDVSSALPSVKCFYTPNGMTKDAWNQAKNAFGI